ncbi:hypothetical protein HUS23_03405 [Ectothiorhodospiraceae bacterium 2226]|nr:hypothetical protein HUS23_03405 [Ectothiorhodospiraceae bacterium 2226]
MTDDVLERERPLPDGTGADGVVHWRVFRHREAARDYLPAIQLGTGQRIVGGYSRDSVGALWWIGVQVDNVHAWGNLSAINKHAKTDT